VIAELAGARGQEAFRCFMDTEFDVLAVGNLYLQKSEQKRIPIVDFERRPDLKPKQDLKRQQEVSLDFSPLSIIVQFASSGSASSL
jgi:hypothetical protein